MSEKLKCPSCGSDQVTIAHIQRFMANTLEHYCHSVKVQDADSPAECVSCEWMGCHDDLDGYKKRGQ